MALSDDQKAMLRLLAQREEGYEDIAALMGLSVEEVRAKVKDALEGLEGSGATKPESPPPPPKEPEPPPEPPKAEPPPAKAAPKPAPPKPKRPSAPRPAPRLKLPANRSVQLSLLAGALVLVLVVVLLVAGGSGGGDSSDDTGSSTANSVSDTPLDTKRVTGAVLQPVDGGDAIGRAVLGRAGKEPLLQIEAEGLEPSAAGETYTVWLYKSPRLALRAGAVKVGESGGIAAQFPIPVEVLQYIAGGAFNQIYISRTSTAAYNAEVEAAKKDKRLPRYTGETVLRGPIVGPLVGAGGNQGG